MEKLIEQDLRVFQSLEKRMIHLKFYKLKPKKVDDEQSSDYKIKNILFARLSLITKQSNLNEIVEDLKSELQSIKNLLMRKLQKNKMKTLTF